MRSLSFKLIVAFFGIGVLSVAAITLLARWNTRAEFVRFVNDQDQQQFVGLLSDYYASNGSWVGVARYLNRQRLRFHLPPFVLASPDGTVIVADDRLDAGLRIPTAAIDSGLGIVVGDEIVGVLILNRAVKDVPLEGIATREAFIDRTNLTFLYGAIGAVLVILFLGIFFSRTLTRPLRELTVAAHAISAGDFDQQVPIRSDDEMGDLARAFNCMSAELSRSVNARKQMTADIAHELRTPLSLILGHAEAVHDGVLPPTLDNFEIIREEAVRLEHLVDDLRTLSLADAGELRIIREKIEPQRIVLEAESLYRVQAQKKNITLNVEIASPLALINVDPSRMLQVITNILDNAIRHTPEGGCIDLSAKQLDDQIELVIRDSGAGILPEDAERIFERFYRTDAARQRHAGGSGLGLAISKSIVEAHGGHIRAESGAGQGLAVIISLSTAA